MSLLHCCSIFRFWMLSEEQREIDQNFFEQRLQKTISTLHPYAVKWRFLRFYNFSKMKRFFRIILVSVILLTVVCTYNWLNDPATSNSPLLVSLRSHPFFLLRFLIKLSELFCSLKKFSCFLLVSSLTFGIHQRVVAPSILVQRIRYVLSDYGMTLSPRHQLILQR